MKRLTGPLVLAVLAVAAVACSSGASSTTPPLSPSGVSITTPEDAAARVIELNPSFEGIEPRDPDVIGGCCFWLATPSADGFEVTIEVGWGDCPSGCIDRHRWTYAVSRDGDVQLLSESGPPVPAGEPGSGAGGSSGGGILPGGTGIEGRVVAGPTCPVVTFDDPACDDRPVPGATIVVLDAAGTEVARTTSDAAGHYEITLPPGPYTIEPQPLEGFFRVAEPVMVTVTGGVVTADIAFDTGIR
jgi:hypothetical protein